jgi:hypothetical protein
MRTILGGFLGKIPRPTPAMVVALLALLIACSGAAVAAIPSSDGTITACRDNRSGALRVIDAASQTCTSKETQLTWINGLPGSTVDKAANAANADKLDNKDSTEFLGKTEKASDSALFDGKDPSAFLGADQKATDAEKLDGLDSTQLPHGFYQVEETFTRASPANGFAAGVVLCDEGDKVVGGGYGALDSTSWIATDAPALDQGHEGTQSGWVITWKTLDPNTTDDIRVSALCADFGETHNN